MCDVCLPGVWSQSSDWADRPSPVFAFVVLVVYWTASSWSCAGQREPFARNLQVRIVGEPHLSRDQGDRMRTVEVAPRPSALIESMRDIGYSLGTALADLVDNSLTAGAGTVRIFANAAGPELRVGILDDGSGMSEDTLLSAMRLGARSPLDDRERSDLGRFGLGLKTASFSQCRSLSVVSRRNEQAFGARWDLDYVAETDEWRVQVLDDLAAIPWTQKLGKRGTLVVWEKLVGDGDAGRDQGEFVRQLDEARTHLELVFHRFLAGEPGLKKINILLNERPLEPVDPFHASHPATIVGPVERILVNDEIVVVQPFTLPHHSKVRPADWERYARAEGYVKNQGFYVYREKRLIIHGTWFGLARQTELTKLARVRIDMPNTLDRAWKIDIKKASAQLPPPMRRRLAKIIEPLGAASRRVYTTRGRRLVENSRVPFWSRIQVENGILYRINEQHPMVADITSRLESDAEIDLLRLLEIAGSALPMDALFADMGGTPDRMGNATTSDDSLHLAAVTTFRFLTDSGEPAERALSAMRDTEPFRSNWDRTREILSNEASDAGTVA